MISLTTHRKFWNILLLLTFSVTGILGMLLVIQINYKFSFSFIKNLIQWHVDFGIGMFFIAIFHFLWHIRYYTKLLKRKTERTSEKKSEETRQKTDQVAISGITNRKKILFTIIILGLSSITTQVILVKEFLSVFSGNEIIVGIIIANWMLITGLGAMMGKNYQGLTRYKQTIYYTFLLLAIFPVITAFLINFLKNIVFQPGTTSSLQHIFVLSFILLLPYCLLSGFMFTFFSNLYSTIQQHNQINKVYAYESIGSLAGGIVFNLVLVYFLNNFQCLSIIALINLGIVMLFSTKTGNKVISYIVFPLLIIMIIFINILNIEKIAKQFIYPNQEIVYLDDTPYGNLTVTKQGSQINLYENNVLIYYTDNTIANEEAVHYTMLQHTNPKKILLISGGISGITHEILKYDIQYVDYLEINPRIFTVGKKFNPGTLEDNRIHMINQDARYYLANQEKKYDVVLINLPAPMNIQLNRYYTVEFFRKVNKKLQPNGILGISLPTSMNYLSENAVKTNSVLYATLKKVFQHVLIIPGDNNYFISSNQILTLDYASLFNKRNIQNEYINSYYIDNDFLKNRSHYMHNTLEDTEMINTDFKPLAFHHQLLFWLSRFKLNAKIFWGIIILIGTFFFIRQRPVEMGLFAGGFSASSLELLLLISFQIIFGYFYHITGIIFGVFMAGIGLGALYVHKIIKRYYYRFFLIFQISIALFALILPVILGKLNNTANSPVLVHLTIYVLTLVIAAITGSEFALSTKIKKAGYTTIAAENYSIDLIGSAFGAILFSAFVFPLLGLWWACVLIACINLISASYGYYKRNIYRTYINE